MFSKGAEIAKTVERIKDNLHIDNKNSNNKILKDIIEAIKDDEDAIETLQKIITHRDLFELYTSLQIDHLIYLIMFEENETNPIRRRLLEGGELLGTSWLDPGSIKQHLLDLTNYMYKNDLKKVSQNELATIFVNDVEIAKYILNNCQIIEKDPEGKYSFKSDEYRAYMKANLTLKATMELARKYN